MNWTPEKISALTDKRLENLLINAQRLRDCGVVELIHREQARRLYGDDVPGEMAFRFEQIIRLYEKSLYQKHGRHVKANRTRRAVKEKGLIPYLEEKAFQKESIGLSTFEDEGVELSSENTFEGLIADFSDYFSHEAVLAAQSKLKKWSSS